MNILKIYDTVLESKNNAVNDYRDYITRGLDVKFYPTHPYNINVDDDCYIYAANNLKYLLGMRFDKIEDYTRSGVCDEIKACKLYTR